MTNPAPGRATIVGIGLIGGSIGAALRARGWVVSGVDIVPELVRQGIEFGVCDAEGFDPESDLVVVATPVGTIVAEVDRALTVCPRAAVTDVGGVKAAIVDGIDDPRFVGGHPMAGSEALGLAGAHAELFEGAAWVLCPGPSTADSAYALVREVVVSLGAQALTLTPADHDRAVAVVSHVPHLTAAALVRVADAHSSDHAAVLRLAAGGFRDMTRIAAGSPAIWPGVCAQNREAILEILDQLRDELGILRSVVADNDASRLIETLTDAQSVRRNLPSRPDSEGPHREVRVLIRDHPGSIKAVATLATDLDINLASANTVDFDGTTGGLLLLRVLATDAGRFVAALVDAGFRAFVQGDGET